MPIQIKGERDGLVLALDALYAEAASPDETIAALQTYLDQHGAFFRGGHVILETGEQAFDREFLQRVIETLQAHALQTIALRGHHPETRAAAHALGLELPFVPTYAPDHMSAEPEEGVPALLIRRTLRSGQRVAYDGSVVVWGDVNAGAEIVAGGDVFVWGTLRGVVHAGAFGDETAVVAALRLEPTQLRIGGLIARAPDEQQPRSRWRFWRRQRPQPELARAVDGVIVVEAVQLER